MTDDEIRRRFPGAKIGHVAKFPPANPKSKRKAFRKRKPKPMATWAFLPPSTWVLPVITASETNERAWRARSHRSKEANLIIGLAMKAQPDTVAAIRKHFHAGGRLRVRLTRLGGRRLDRLSNLGASLKGVEDAVCRVLGCNDGDDRWEATAHQETGGAVGVRIELECLP